MNETKTAALKEFDESGKRKSLKQKVLDLIIQKGFVTEPEITTILFPKQEDKKRSSVTGRIGDLQDEGKVETVPKKNPRIQIYTHQPNENLQKLNAYQRKREKYQGIIKRLKSEFPEFIGDGQLTLEI